MSRHEHDWEPVRGLPEALPQGERILWQGAPDWRHLALEAFHLRTASLYLLGCWALAIIGFLADGAGLAPGLQSGVWLALAGMLGGGILAGLAFLYAKSAVFTITNKRVVIRAGLAIPKAVNLPFGLVESAALKQRADGVGDIPLTLAKPHRAAFLHLWPFVRPGRFARPEPMLRAVPEAGLVADILARALRQDLAAKGQPVPPVPRRSELSSECAPGGAEPQAV